jgi:hypothetical protein
MRESKARYVQFPLFMINEIFTDKRKFLEDVLCYGIKYYSERFNYDETAIARQLIYDYYHEKVSPILKLQIEGLDGIVGCDERLGHDANGFFDPVEEVDELLIAFNTNLDLYKNSVEHYQVHMALISLKIDAEVAVVIERAFKVRDRVPNNEPHPMINVDTIFKFRDHEKTQYELIQLVAYLAIKSILGRKDCVKTNKKHILARMLGYSSVQVQPRELPDHLAALYAKYSHRYHMDRLLSFLETEWNVRCYSTNAMRGIYIGVKNKISYEQMAVISESSKRSSKIRELKRQKREAHKKALSVLSQYSNQEFAGKDEEVHHLK